MSSTSSQVLADSVSDSSEPECELSPSASVTNTAAPYSASTGPTSRASETFTPLTQTDWVGLDESISSVGASLANPSALPEDRKPRKTTVTSGRKCAALLHSRDPLGSLAKMLLGSSRWHSMTCWLTWKALATPRGRLLFRLLPSMRDIAATEFGSLLPTPTAQNYGTNQGGASGRTGPVRPSLSTMAKYSLWPTPTSITDTGGAALCKWGGARSREKIRAMVGDAELNGALNPEWVEWLMGYPIGWTALDPSEMPSSRKSSKRSAEQSCKSTAVS
jgi:hypothetical protein